MKKIINFLPAMAILLASGLAIATTSKVNTANVGWNGSQWIPLPPSYSCDKDFDEICTGYDDGNGHVEALEEGRFTY